MVKTKRAACDGDPFCIAIQRDFFKLTWQEDRLVHRSRIADNGESEIAHIFLCDGLHVLRLYLADVVEKLE